MSQDSGTSFGKMFDKPVSRRRLIGTGAAAGAGLTAAILGGGAALASSGGGLGGRVVRSQDGGTEFHSAWPYLEPNSGGHYNTFVTNGIMNPPNIYGDLTYEPMAMYYWGSKEWLPLLATEWSFIVAGAGPGTPGASPVVAASPAASPAAGGVNLDADTLEVKLREGVVWSDGTPFTSKDVVDTFWVLRIMSNTVWKYVDDVYAVDDFTVRAHMSLPSTVVERYVVRNSPRPSSVYGEWAQKGRDVFGAGKTIDDPEGAQLLEQFTAFRPENVPGTGPYLIDAATMSNAQFTMVKNDKCWNVQGALFDKIANFNGETEAISAVVLNKDIDYATQGFSPATEKQMVDSGIRVLRPPTYSGASVLINFATLSAAFGDPKARQGLAHAIDRQRSGTISLAESGVPVQYMSGMADALVPDWIADPETAFNKYEYDTEKASALLMEAGWTKDGDKWKTPDGADAAFDLMFQAEFADYSATGNDLAAQLTEFGIAIEPRAVTYTQVPIDTDKGNFQITIAAWGSSANPHPHFSYTTAFFTNNTLAVNNGGKGIAFPLEQETASGKFDLSALTVGAAEGLDENAQKEKVEVIAKVYNELLPKLPIYERFGNNAGLEGVRVQAWPADDDNILKNSPYADGIPTMLIFQGQLEPFQG